ncbi:MAG: hypothetical protein AAFR81_28095 [Chloroflexota bacterium]
MPTPEQDIHINNLKQLYPKNSRYYLSPDKAHENLKQMTKQDFGYDAEAWQKWFDEEEHPFDFTGFPHP